MKQIKNIFSVLSLILSLTSPAVMSSQQTPTYKIDFVRSAQFTSGDQNHILVILAVTPTVKNFKMILSMRVTYEIGQGTKVIDVLKQKEKNIRITIYGKDIPEKDQKIFNLIKDRINMNAAEDMSLIVFDFYNITKEKVDSMSIIYGLWEGKNEDIRNEKTFTFKVDNID